jgi:hypothetical protein
VKPSRTVIFTLPNTRKNPRAKSTKAPLSAALTRLVGAENLIWRTDQGRCTRKNVGTCRATYVPHSVAPAVRPDPDGELEILVSNPIGVFGTHRVVRDTSQMSPRTLSAKGPY